MNRDTNILVVSSSEFSIFYEYTNVMFKDNIQRMTFSPFITPNHTIANMMAIDFTLLIQSEGRKWYQSNPSIHFESSIIDLPATITKTLICMYGIYSCYNRVYDYYSYRHDWEDLHRRFGIKGVSASDIKARYSDLSQKLRLLLRQQ